MRPNRSSFAANAQLAATPRAAPRQYRQPRRSLPVLRVARWATCAVGVVAVLQLTGVL